MSQGELDQARSLLSSQVSLNGFDSHYSEVLGDIEVKAGNLSEARTQYENARRSLNSSDVAYRRLLAIKLDRLPFDDGDGDDDGLSDQEIEVIE